MTKYGLPMGRATTQMSALSAGDAVLGLLIEEPANTYQLERRLERRFGSSSFAHGTAYHAVRRLAEQGLIRPRDNDEATRPYAEPATAAVDYEATSSGVKHFEGWLRASTSTPPVREELLAKVAFCTASDLPRMVEIVRDAELACTARLNELNRRMREERLRAGDDAWRRLMTLIVTAGDVAWWDARIKWLQDMRRYLQREGQHYKAQHGSSSVPPRP
jgi:DNA-binding PadR family transcriptional regulator